MRDKRIFATRRVTAQLKKAENQLDAAGIELFQLEIILLEARREIGTSATFAADEIHQAVDAIADWNRTRQKTVGSHEGLLEVARMLGTREVAVGDGDDRPQYADFPLAGVAASGTGRHLTAVA